MFSVGAGLRREFGTEMMIAGIWGERERKKLAERSVWWGSLIVKTYEQQLVKNLFTSPWRA